MVGKRYGRQLSLSQQLGTTQATVRRGRQDQATKREERKKEGRDGRERKDEGKEERERVGEEGEGEGEVEVEESDNKVRKNCQFHDEKRKGDGKQQARRERGSHGTRRY